MVSSVKIYIRSMGNVAHISSFIPSPHVDISLGLAVAPVIISVLGKHMNVCLQKLRSSPSMSGHWGLRTEDANVVTGPNNDTRGAKVLIPNPESPISG